MAKTKGRPSYEPIRILKKSKLKVKDKEHLTQINSAIKLLQGVSTGRIVAFYSR